MAKREIKSLEDLADYFQRRAWENLKRANSYVEPSENREFHIGKRDAYLNAESKTRELIEMEEMGAKALSRYGYISQF